MVFTASYKSKCQATLAMHDATCLHLIHLLHHYKALKQVGTTGLVVINGISSCVPLSMLSVVSLMLKGAASPRNSGATSNSGCFPIKFNRAEILYPLSAISL